MPKKTALITGASAGIGYELSRVFAQNGYDLILVARRVDKLKALAEELKAEYGTNATVMGKDLMAQGAANVLFDEVSSAGLSVDVLVNNAGRGHYTKFLDNEVAIDEATLQLNIVTLTTLSKLFGQAMVAQGGGKILNVASIAAFIPGPMMALYNASKAYVLSFSEALNTELKNQNVTVTASCPGPTTSEFMALASSDKLDNLKYARFMKADVVALEAYKATISGRSVVVHGTVNKAITFAPRITPRAVIPKLVQRFMK